MKKILSIIMSLSMIFFISTPVMAADRTNFKEKIITSINEYDYFVMLQKSTSEELSNLNLTEEDVKAAVEEFYKAVAKRAKLSDNELIGYGYTPDEIEILKSYNFILRSGTANPDSKLSTGLKAAIDTKTIIPISLRAISGTLTGKIKLGFCGTKYASFRYEWEWDHAPLIAAYDSAAMRWVGYDSKGHEIDLLKISESSKIDHYVGNMFVFSKTGQPETNLDFNSVNIQFKVGDFYFPPNGDRIINTYAKKGLVTISLMVDDSVKNKINYIKVAALYGHTILGFDFPSISLSPSGAISIGFSGNLSIDAIGGHKVKIGADSSIKDI